MKSLLIFSITLILLSSFIVSQSIQSQNEINLHINSIEKAKKELSDDMRTVELKNWLNYLKS